MPLPDRTRKALGIVGLIARPLMLEHYGRESCIAATRILKDTLLPFGVTVTPLPVQVEVYNRAYTARLAARKTRAGRDEAAIKLGSGRNDTPDNPIWPWHLTGVVSGEDTHLLVDLSLDQLNGHAPGFDLSPLAAPVPLEVLTVTGYEHRLIAKGHAIIYTAHPEVRTYEQSLDWKPNDFRSAMVERMVEVIREHLVDAPSLVERPRSTRLRG